MPVSLRRQTLDLLKFGEGEIGHVDEDFAFIVESLQFRPQGLGRAGQVAVVEKTHFMSELKDGFLAVVSVEEDGLWGHL